MRELVAKNEFDQLADSILVDWIQLIQEILKSAV
jgi:hypothetical protein